MSCFYLDVLLNSADIHEHFSCVGTVPVVISSSRQPFEEAVILPIL